MALNSNERKAQKLIVAEVEKAVLLLQSHLQKFCDENKAQSVPMVYIKASIEILLKSYKKGAGQ